MQGAGAPSFWSHVYFTQKQQGNDKSWSQIMKWPVNGNSDFWIELLKKLGSVNKNRVSIHNKL